MKLPVKGWLEQDYLTPWRRVRIRYAGDARAAKKHYNRRVRHMKIEVDE